MSFKSWLFFVLTKKSYTSSSVIQKRLVRTIHNFEIFFARRWKSIDDLERKFPKLYKAWYSWLNSELTMEPRHKVKTTMEMEQDQFKEEYARDMEEAAAQEGVQLM